MITQLAVSDKVFGLVLFSCLVLDAVEVGRACVPRHPAKRKLTDAQVQRAATRYSFGLSIAALAEELDVNAETLRKEFIRSGVRRRK